jgi:hypothetical protein
MAFSKSMQIIMIFIFALAFIVVVIMFYTSMRPSIQGGLLTQLVAPLSWLLKPVI